MSKIEKNPAVGLNAAVAATLNAERVASGKTFKALAAETGISKESLIRYLSTTERHISIEAIRAIGQVLELTVADVMDMADQRLERERVRQLAREPRHDDNTDPREDA